MAEIAFTVPGVLPGWQRAGVRRGKHYTQEQTRNAKAEVAAWARQAAAGEMLKGAIGLEMTVWLPAPKRGRSGGWATGKPDLDNLAKLVCDALNKVAYHDDAEICRQVLEKRYSATPRAEIRVWELEPAVAEVVAETSRKLMALAEGIRNRDANTVSRARVML